MSAIESWPPCLLVDGPECRDQWCRLHQRCFIQEPKDGEPGKDGPDIIPRTATDLEDALIGALQFIMAFYEPGQRHLDTEAWKNAEADGRRALARAKAEVIRP